MAYTSQAEAEARVNQRLERNSLSNFNMLFERVLVMLMGQSGDTWLTPCMR